MPTADPLGRTTASPAQPAEFLFSLGTWRTEQRVAETHFFLGRVVAGGGGGVSDKSAGAAERDRQAAAKLAAMKWTQIRGLRAV